MARWDNCVEIVPSVVDNYGIPALRINRGFCDNENAMIPGTAEASVEMTGAVGGQNTRLLTVPDRQPGYDIHDVGVARMGHKPRKSVLSRLQQCQDMPNLLFLDGSGLTSTACQNPPLAIVALCVRSCDQLMQERNHGNV